MFLDEAERPELRARRTGLEALKFAENQGSVVKKEKEKEKNKSQCEEVVEQASLKAFNMDTGVAGSTVSGGGN